MLKTISKTRIFIIGAIITIGVVSTILLSPTVINYFSSPIKINQTIAFNQNEIQNQTYLGKGWSTPEVWGVWMDGKSAKITLPLPDQKPSELQLSLQAFLNPNISTQSLNIYINGKDSGVLTIGEGQTTFIGTLKDIDLSKVQFLSIELRPSNPIKPKDLGLGEDERLLSVGLISAKYR